MQDYSKLPNRRRQWRIVGAIWVIAILLWLATCTGSRVDIDLVEVIPEISGKVMGIDKPLELILSVGPDVTDDEILQWAAKQCRRHLVLPPVEAVPRIVRQTGQIAERREIGLHCYRDKWSVPE